MLFAERDGTCLALAATPDLLRGSAGFVGVSDGWQDLVAHKTMTWQCPRARRAATSRSSGLAVGPREGTCLVALAFGGSPGEARPPGRASLLAGF
ncbi:MAG: hypothetical protein R2708_24085 [Vicinamibacterales bacterium]